MVSDVLTNLNRKRVFEFATARKVPAIYENNLYVRDGGLMSYGPDLDKSLNRVAYLVDRILKGTNPPICRSSNRLRSGLRSISKPRRCLIYLCHSCCYSKRMKSSSEAWRRPTKPSNWLGPSDSPPTSTSTQIPPINVRRLSRFGAIPAGGRDIAIRQLSSRKQSSTVLWPRDRQGLTLGGLRAR